MQTSTITGTLQKVNYLPPKALITLLTITRVAVVQQGSVSLDKGNGQLLEEVADGGGLLLSRVASKGAAQLLDLADGGLVPGPKALDRQWREDNTLVMAGLPRFVQFPLVGDNEGVSRGLSSLGNKCCLQGVDNCDIKGAVFAPGMSGNEHFGWLATLPWE